MIINSMGELLTHYGEKSPHSLGRSFYKDTDCGVFTNFILEGDRKVNYEDIEASRKNITPAIKAIQIGSIIEGSDAEVEGITLSFPIDTDQLDRALEDIEVAADELWQEANA